MCDHCLSKLHEQSLLRTDVIFPNTCGYQLTINTTFVVAMVAAKEFMICLNHVTARKSLQEKTLSMDTITRQYVCFGKV